MEKLTGIRLFLSQIRYLIRKEIRALLKDPKTRLILIVPVIIQATLFGYAANFDLHYAPYAVIDECHCKPSTDLLAKLDSTGIFIRKLTASTPAQLEDSITSRETAVAIRIPSDFAAKLSRGEKAPVQVLLDGRNSVTAGLAGAYIGQIISAYSAEVTGTSAALSLETRAWYNPNLDTRWNILIGLIAALAMIQTLLMSAFSVAREREQGTFDQLLVTPLTPPQILVGKAIPPVLIGLFQSTLVVLLVVFWFEIPMSGSVGLIYLSLLFFNIAAVGMGLSISAVSSSMQQAMLYAFLLVVPFMVLSGFLSPVSNMAVPLQWATYANPLRFGVDAVRRVYLEGAGLAEIWFDFVPLTCIALVSLPIAGWLFRNKLS